MIDYLPLTHPAADQVLMLVLLAVVFALVCVVPVYTALQASLHTIFLLERHSSWFASFSLSLCPKVTNSTDTSQVVSQTYCPL